VRFQGSFIVRIITRVASRYACSDSMANSTGNARFRVPAMFPGTRGSLRLGEHCLNALRMLGRRRAGIVLHRTPRLRPASRILHSPMQPPRLCYIRHNSFRVALAARQTGPRPRPLTSSTERSRVCNRHQHTEIAVVSAPSSPPTIPLRPSFLPPLLPPAAANCRAVSTVLLPTPR
jgi:hypothetical protein